MARTLDKRIAELGEEKVMSFQRIGVFLDRRFSPAMATCQAVNDRIKSLAERSERASNLLRTRVEVALEAQNQQVLKTMENSAERDLIKRVIALPGETIDIDGCQVYIDGRLLIEPYLDPEVAPCTDPNAFDFPYLVPDDTVFVMGDNRPGSKDSRDIGAVQYGDLLGRAFVVIWPTEDWEWL